MNSLLNSLNKNKTLTEKNPNSLLKLIQTKSNNPKHVVRALYYIAVKSAIKKKLIQPKQKSFQQTIRLIVDSEHKKRDPSLVKFIISKFQKNISNIYKK